MKNVKLWVIALMVLMMFGTVATMVASPNGFYKTLPSVRADDTETITGTFVIDQNTTDPLTGEKGKYGFDSNVVVASTGTLIVKNATIYFLADIAHPRSLKVYGSLILDNAILTVSTSLIQPDYHLNVTIDGTLNPTAKVDIINSKVRYEGWFNVINKTKNIFLKNSAFSKIDISGTYGPTPLFENSKVNMVNCSFNNLFEHPSSGYQYIGDMVNYTGGTATSSSEVDLNNFTAHKDATYGIYWDTVPLNKLEVMLNYTTSNNYDNGSYLTIIYRNVVLMKYRLFKPGNVTAGENSTYKSNDTFVMADLKASDIENYIKTGEFKVVISQVDGNGTVTVRYARLLFYIEKNVAIYGIKKFDFNLVNSTIFARDLYVDADFELNYGTTHNRISLYNGSKLYVLNLTVVNTPNKVDSCIYTNDNGSVVYIFRYAKVHVTFKDIPISGLYVNATPYLIDNNLRKLVLENTRVFIDNASYGHMSGDSIGNITDSNGYAYIPLMSDIVDKTEWPNSRYVGVYNLWVNKSATNYYRAQIAVDHFPNLQPSNNTLVYNAILSTYKHVDVGVSMWIRNHSPYLTGKAINVTLNITNYGTEDATDVYAYIYVNGNPVIGPNLPYYLPTLDSGQTIHHTFMLPGSLFDNNRAYNISAEVQQIWDTNPSNNVTYKIIHVGKISVTSWDVGKLVHGHMANITVGVYSYYKLSSVSVEVDANGTPIHTQNYLLDGQNTISFSWMVTGPTGWVTLALKVNDTLIGTYKVYVYRDVDISVNSISLEPQQIFVNQNVTIYVNVTNLGNDMPKATTIIVNITNPYNFVVRSYNITASFVGNKEYSFEFVPTSPGMYSIVVTVTGSEDYNPNNNYLSESFQVGSAPFTVAPSSDNVFVNGTDIKIMATLSSVISSNVSVYMHINSLNLTISPVNINNPFNISKNGNVVVVFTIPQKDYEVLLKGTSIRTVQYTIVVKPANMKEYIFGQYSFILKELPDFQITQGSLVIEENNKVVNGGKVAEGVIISVQFMVRNTGGTAGNVTYAIKDNNKTVSLKTLVSLAPGKTRNITYNYTISGLGIHNIEVVLNPAHNISERSYSNNNANVTVNVIPPAMEILYSITSQEHHHEIFAGDHVIIVVHVINKNATESQNRNVYMQGAMVTVRVSGLGTYHATTNTYGVARIEFVAKQSGKFTPSISVTYMHNTQSVSSAPITVKEQPLINRIPWMWVIIGAVAIGIAVFFLYGYLSFKKEANEYMICGNCGHLIPADAERCPYCGAVFEKDKVQCPDCGSWIDADSKFCPVCGSVFMNPEEKDYDKYTALRERYQQYLTKYKEEARKYIGDDYTTEEFFKWWKTHPEYISFQEWVKRQEEDIEGDTVKCPVCGALNPKGAKVCRVCGSPLPEENEEVKVHEAERTMVSDSVDEDSIMKKYKEEYEKLQHPGVVSFEEWVKRKETERKDDESKDDVQKTNKEREEKNIDNSNEKSSGKSVEEKVKEGYIKCPVCGALNKPGSKVCAVCGAPLEVEKKEEEVKKPAHSAKPVVKKKVIKKVVRVDKGEKK